MKVLSPEQTRAMDRRAIEEFHIPGLLLMESAALRVAAAVEQRIRIAEGASIVIVCGKGNNGGDGLAVARHLKSRGGSPTVWLTAAPEAFSGDAAVNLELAERFAIPVGQITPETLEPFTLDLQGSALIVDAIFGTGFKGPVTGTPAEAIDRINAAVRPVLSIDIPSGVDARSGAVEGSCVRAEVTVTFCAPKTGLLLYPGAALAGTIEVFSIGMPREILEEAQSACHWLTGDLVNRWLPRRKRSRDANKGRYGHVLVIAGGAGYAGAAQIAAEAAARSGAGLVTLAAPVAVLTAIQSRLNAAVMTHGLSSTSEGTVDSAALNDALEFSARCAVVAIGPGLAVGRSPETAAFVQAFVRACTVPLIVDADAITALSHLADRGTGAVKARKGATVFTPHPGEMARLLGTTVEEIQKDRPSSVLAAALTYNAVFLLKGDRTLIATPTGAWYINSTGNPGMATGGSGDALTGIIAGLMAQGVPAPESAAAGAFLHGLSGDIAVRLRGAREGLIATDLIENFPGALEQMRKTSPARIDEGVIAWEE